MATPKDRAPAPLDDEVHVLVTLDRKTGRVTYDDEFSTVLETWAMLTTATELAGARVDEANGLPNDAP